MTLNSVKQQYTVFCLHGWGFSSEVLQPWLSYWDRTIFSLHVVDLPGYGKNHALTFSLSACLEYLENLIVTPAILLGWSLGGTVAMQFAKRHPTRVQALVILANNPCFLQNKYWPGVLPQDWIRFYERVAADAECGLHYFIRLITAQKNKRHAREMLLSTLAQENKPTKNTLLKGLQILSDLVTELVFDQPLLAVYGAEDPLIPNTLLEVMKKTKPDMSIFSIAQGGHPVFLVEPEKTSHRVQSWIVECVHG